ncbi:MAG: Xaa-Pro peptidase family protein [bacterium]
MLIKEKVKQAVGILQEYQIDCWITFTRESALNGDPTLPYLVPADLTWHSALIISSTGKTCAIVGKYDKQMIEDLQVYDEVTTFVEGIKKPFQEYLTKLDPKTIAINYSKDSEICDGLTHGMYLTLYDFLAEIDYQERLVSAETIISALRQRKTPAELGFIRKAIDITLEVYAEVARFIKPGKTEVEIAEFMKERVKERGVPLAWEPKVCPAVFTGPDTAGAHYSPTERVAQEGHILNIDFGVKYEQYCSDIQRTFYLLKKGETQAPPDVLKGFTTIVRSIEDSRSAMRPGILGKEIDAIARNLIVSEGYEEFPHALGHQVGRFAHDGTALLGPAWEKYAKKPFIPLEKNMVFTIEPRLTVPGRGVATIEEMVVVTDDGAEFLSAPQTDLILISPE